MIRLQQHTMDQRERVLWHEAEEKERTRMIEPS